MYTISDYGAMIVDTARLAAVQRALQRVITPDSVVVDIGTGTGILALFACRLGARRVYAIEPDSAVQVARDAAAANGFSDRLECIEALSTSVTLPEHADVIVSDIGGVLPWLQQHLPAVIDARTRFLKPGGALIPRRDTLWLAPVEAGELYGLITGPWETRPCDLDLTSGRTLAVNAWRKGRLSSTQLLARPVRAISLDYAAVTDCDLAVSVEWTIDREALAHGVGAGIDRVLVDDIGFSNAPDCPSRLPDDSIYRTAFFPWPGPVPVTAGDRVRFDLRADLVGDDYVWTWHTAILAAGDAAPKARFTQSTHFATPLTPTRLAKRAASYRPSLNEQGELMREVLEGMRERATVAEIARRVASRFPARFRRAQDALDYVAELAGTFG
jgi:protein arginine N-methyltransferase 1